MTIDPDQESSSPDQEPLNPDQPHSKKKIIIGIAVVITVAIVITLIVGVFVFLNLRTEPTELTEQETSEVRPFVISTLDWEPHVYLDEEGIVRGISVDVVDRIFSRLNVAYEIRVIPWPRVLKEVQTGEADASLATSYTDERTEFLYYVEEGLNYTSEPFPPYFVTVSDSVFFVRKQIKDAVIFDTPEEIVERGYRVGVISGFYSAEKIYETGIDPANVVEYFDTESGFQGLDGGVIDIYLQEKAVGFTVLNRMGLGERITAHPQSFFKNPQYVAFSKQSDYPDLLNFREQFLDELRKIHESGEYDEIYNSYIE